VQETYETTPAIREACERSITGHAATLEADIEAAKAWYNSPAYREAREHRFKGAEYRAVIVQGV
jgi:uncharacterized protein (DUF1330 family)